MKIKSLLAVGLLSLSSISGVFAMDNVRLTEVKRGARAMGSSEISHEDDSNKRAKTRGSESEQNPGWDGGAWETSENESKEEKLETGSTGPEKSGNKKGRGKGKHKKKVHLIINSEGVPRGDTGPQGRTVYHKRESKRPLKKRTEKLTAEQTVAAGTAAAGATVPLPSEEATSGIQAGRIVNHLYFADGKTLEASDFFRVFKQKATKTTFTAGDAKEMRLEISKLTRQGYAFDDIINARDYTGRPLLLSVVCENKTANLEMANWLIHNGADHNARDAAGTSALELAVILKNNNILRVFLNNQESDTKEQETKEIKEDDNIRSLDEDEEKRSSVRNDGKTLLHILIEFSEKYDGKKAEAELELIKKLMYNGDSIGNIKRYSLYEFFQSIRERCCGDDDLSQEILGEWEAIFACCSLLAESKKYGISTDIHGKTQIDYALEKGLIPHTLALAFMAADKDYFDEQPNEVYARIINILAETPEKIPQVDEKNEMGVNQSIMNLLYMFFLRQVDRDYIVSTCFAVPEGKLAHQNPIHRAVQTGSSALVSFVNMYNNFANAQDDQGKTPLHYAVSNGSVFAVKTLLNAGVDYTVKDNPIMKEGKIAAEGKSAVERAFEQGDKKIVLEFLKADIKKNSVALLDKYGQSVLQDFPDLLKFAQAAKADACIVRLVEIGLVDGSLRLSSDLFNSCQPFDGGAQRKIFDALVKHGLVRDPMKTVDDLIRAFRLIDAKDSLAAWRDEKTGDSLLHRAVQVALRNEDIQYRALSLTTELPMDTIMITNGMGKKAIDLCFEHDYEAALKLAYYMILRVIRSTKSYHTSTHKELFIKSLTAEQMARLKTHPDAKYFVSEAIGYKEYSIACEFIKHGFPLADGILNKFLNPRDNLHQLIFALIKAGATFSEPISSSAS